MYSFYFKFYAYAHFLAGLMIVASPNLLDPIFIHPIHQGETLLLGTLSLMVGCGFYGASKVETPSEQLGFIKWGFAANLINILGHVLNIAYGNTPLSMGYFSAGSITVLIICLTILHHNVKDTIDSLLLH